MFGGGSLSTSKTDSAVDDTTSGYGIPSGLSVGSTGNRKNGKSSSLESDRGKTLSTSPITTPEKSTSSNKGQAGSSSPPTSDNATEHKKRRSSGVSSRASSLLASAKNSLNFSQAGRLNTEMPSSGQTSLQKLVKQDAALAVPQGQQNNSAGESLPGPRSTFRVGVWEDKNKKCRRTMEDTHAFLYNFLRTPALSFASTDKDVTNSAKVSSDSGGSNATAPSAANNGDSMETDNGYFAIFDGHAGSFAADWCGKKLHLILEEVIRKSPNSSIPELLDQAFTSADVQLGKLPLKNSGCTAAIAVLRWEDRVPSSQSVTGTQAIAMAAAPRGSDDISAKAEEKPANASGNSTVPSRATTEVEATHARLKSNALRQRVLYTANVGDARIILCRSGKALRLSYDHKGSDENEGRRIANAGGMILNNRVNGVLAVTRALGDTYIKDLVTGHPYTTETVIQPELDEFIIIACDGLWDVCSDQDAVNLVRAVVDPAVAAKMLVDHALAHFSTDNLSCMIIRFDKEALAETQKNDAGRTGVEANEVGSMAKLSEADMIVSNIKKKIAESTPAIGVSSSNSNQDLESIATASGGEDSFKRTAIEGSVEEESGCIAFGSLEATSQDSSLASNKEEHVGIVAKPAAILKTDL